MIAENSAVTPLPASASNPNRRHDRVPPHHRSQVPWDSSAQQALLGSILLRGGMLPDVIAVLFADDGPDRWPDPPEEAAYYGLAGDIVRTIAPHTESDPAAVLLHILVLFGNMVGRGPHFTVDGARHGLNLFAVCCGDSSKARKGTAGSQALRLLNPVDSAWASNRVKSGLSSGEGMIFAVRDPVFKNEELVDQGESDKRLMALEPEFARLLKVAARDGNTVSPMIRLAWDNGDLHVLTRTPTKATGAHISIVGHITREELAAELTKTDAANGFGNRFLWSCVRRSKLLPRGGNLRDADIEPLRQRLINALQCADGVDHIDLSAEAWNLWEQQYPILSGGHAGLHGKLTSRAEAQVRRLACVYALLDQCRTVETQHLHASLALWEFCDRSAGYLFGAFGPGHREVHHDPVQEVVDIIRGLGGRTTLKAIRGKRRKFREAGVLEPIIEQAIDRGLLRRRSVSPSGPGAPTNGVELVELAAGQSGASHSNAAGGGTAVPVSVFAGGGERANSDTDTTGSVNTDTDTGNSGNAEVHRNPTQASDLDRVPIELEEANAIVAN